jgi:hypothetical protein
MDSSTSTERKQLRKSLMTGLKIGVTTEICGASTEDFTTQNYTFAGRVVIR